MRKDCVARELTIEVVVGAFMVMVLLGLGYFTIILSKTAVFSKKYPIEMVFNHVAGLRDGDSIMVRGMPTGKVQSLRLEADGVHVIALLDAPIEIREGYEMAILASSMLGGQHLEIKLGDGDRLPLDTVFYGRPPSDLMADAAELINHLKSGVVEGGVIENIRKTTVDLQEMVERVNAGKGMLGKLLSEDDKLYEDLAATMSSLRNVTGKLERGEGVLGQLINDDALYGEIRAVAEEARALIDDYREVSPVLTFTSVFFGAL